MVLNPRQNEQEFVASICDELHIAYPRENATLKTLIDALNAHLLESHTQGRRTVVIIDEAQNLKPEVLEQVRLLTNLETHKEKLLRIMLVGQPELAQLLARPDLRQLAQRITARYHLTPLEPDQIAAYIAHRLKVAGGGELFTPKAIAAIARHARGIPRLVNILCDRALLGAYGGGFKQVSAELVERAAREVGGETHRAPGRRFTVLDAALVTVILGAGAAWFWRQEIRARAIAEPVAPGASADGNNSFSMTPAAAPSASADGNKSFTMTSAAPALTGPAPAQLDQLLRAAQPLPQVLSRLVEIWNAKPQLQADENICLALSREMLDCYKSLGEWRDLRQLNRPAILTLSSGRDGLQHVLLRELGEQDALIETLKGPLRLSLDQIGLLWTGEFLLLWRRATEEVLIGPGEQGASIVWLRQQLAKTEGRTLPAPVSATFDDELRQALIRFQTAQQLDRDGLAGARTLIALDNLNLPAGTPTLRLTATPVNR